jgi:plastocyanin
MYASHETIVTTNRAILAGICECAAGKPVALDAAMTRIFRFSFMMTALTLASSCGSSSSSPTSPSTGGNTGTPITIVSGAKVLTSTAYSPNPLTVSSGTTVTWTNQDSTTHTATSDTGVFNGTVTPNAQFSYTFANKGTFTYHCSLHPNMVGSVVVQ